MTLTLLLQLTDDEQLYAQVPNPEKNLIEATGKSVIEAQDNSAAWPAQEATDSEADAC